MPNSIWRKRRKPISVCEKTLTAVTARKQHDGFFKGLQFHRLRQFVMIKRRTNTSLDSQTYSGQITALSHCAGVTKYAGRTRFLRSFMIGNEHQRHRCFFYEFELIRRRQFPHIRIRQLHQLIVLCVIPPGSVPANDTHGYPFQIQG